MRTFQKKSVSIVRAAPCSITTTVLPVNGRRWRPRARSPGRPGPAEPRVAVHGGPLGRTRGRFGWCRRARAGSDTEAFKRRRPISRDGISTLALLGPWAITSTTPCRRSRCQNCCITLSIPPLASAVMTKTKRRGRSAEGERSMRPSPFAQSAPARAGAAHNMAARVFLVVPEVITCPRLVGRHRSRGLHRLAPGRGARRPGDRVRAMVLYNSFALVGLARARSPPTCCDSRGRARRRPRPGLGARRSMRGVRRRLPPGRADRDPVLLPRARVLRRHQRRRHAERAGGGAGSSRRARIVHTSTSEVYGTAQTVPIDETHPLQAQSPYAASKIAADKLRRELPPELRAAGRHPAAVQHLRPAPVGPRRDPDHHQPDRRRAREVRAGRAATRPATSPTSRDTAAAFLAVGNAPAERVVGRVVQRRHRPEISIGDLVRTIAAG